MANYSIIADVTSYIVKLLREGMCPEPISSPNNVAAVSPSEQDADYILGVYLYDITEDGEVSGPPMATYGRTHMRRPPRPYSLYYMLFVNASSHMGLKSLDVHKVLGRAAQIINDHRVVSSKALQPWLDEDEPPILFTPSKITLEEKTRVWTAINKPYQVALFYKAAPIFLSSDVIMEAHRVTDAQFSIGIKDEFSERGVNDGH